MTGVSENIYEQLAELLGGCFKTGFFFSPQLRLKVNSPNNIIYETLM